MGDPWLKRAYRVKGDPSPGGRTINNPKYKLLISDSSVGNQCITRSEGEVLITYYFPSLFSQAVIKGSEGDLN